MSTDEFKVMRWHGGFDGPWGEAAVERYRRGGFDGLSLVPGADWAPRSLEFVRDLPGLRYLSLTARVSDDLEAFRIEGLEDLTLVTGSRRRVPETVQPRLRALCLTDRPGVDVASRFPRLERLRVGTWRGTDLEMICGAEHLTSVYLEGRRQTGTLAGAESCPAVEEFVSINYSVADSLPLRSLNGLREVKLLAASPTAPHGIIRFSDIASPNLVKVWISNPTVLEGFDILKELPRLREVRLVECRLSDAELQALNSLSGKVDVRIVDPKE
ncbi:hypothetical protein [Streptomyces sp. NPDC001410]|uniref:hypothetical protein n=1 Tax=Streptomyces sp. NPDC001410 TaxID=3364574 RepID=UPI00368B742B